METGNLMEAQWLQLAKTALEGAFWLALFFLFIRLVKD